MIEGLLRIPLRRFDGASERTVVDAGESAPLTLPPPLTRVEEAK